MVFPSAIFNSNTLAWVGGHQFRSFHRECKISARRFPTPWLAASWALRPNDNNGREGRVQTTSPRMPVGLPTRLKFPKYPSSSLMFSLAGRGKDEGVDTFPAGICGVGRCPDG